MRKTRGRLAGCEVKIPPARNTFSSEKFARGKVAIIGPSKTQAKMMLRNVKMGKISGSIYGQRSYVKPG